MVGESGRDGGGNYTVESGGKCVRCKLETRVRVTVGGTYDGERDNDPRGVCGLRAAVTITPAGHGYSAPGTAVACWRCFYESGHEGYSKVFAILVQRHGWAKLPKGGV